MARRRRHWYANYRNFSSSGARVCVAMSPFFKPETLIFNIEFISLTTLTLNSQAFRKIILRSRILLIQGLFTLFPYFVLRQRPRRASHAVPLNTAHTAQSAPLLDHKPYSLALLPRRTAIGGPWAGRRRWAICSARVWILAWKSQLTTWQNAMHRRC